MLKSDPRGYFYTYAGSSQFFLVQNSEFQYFLGFSENDYFFGYEDFVDIFWGHHKIRLYLGPFLCISGSLLKVKVQNGGIFVLPHTHTHTHTPGSLTSISIVSEKWVLDCRSNLYRYCELRGVLKDSSF